MVKKQIRRRFRTPDRETRKRLELSSGPGAYYEQMVAHRADPDVDEPASEEVEVVETWAIQGGEKVKVRVYVDQVEDYEEVLAAWEAAQEEDQS